MSEPTYGQSYGQQYGGPQGQAGPYGTGQQPQQAPYGGYGQQQAPRPGPGGYPSGGMPTPSAPRTPQDRTAMIAQLVTIVGYVCAGAGVLGFVLWLAADGDGIYKFATALQTLILGLGLGGVNFAIGTWLGSKRT